VPLWPVALGLYRFALHSRTIDVLPHDAIVVFGARIFRGGVASDALRARCRAAAALYHRGVSGLVVVSGCQHEDHHSEASVGAQLLMQAGVPASVIVLEPRAANTWENAHYSAALLKTFGATRVVVVSDEYHLWRAARAMRAQGFQVTPAAPTPRGRWHSQLSSYGREAVSAVRALAW
jgi:uncharacterized SAM-binding protein YcdF (DUF218 family)